MSDFSGNISLDKGKRVPITLGDLKAAIARAEASGAPDESTPRFEIFVDRKMVPGSHARAIHIPLQVQTDG